LINTIINWIFMQIFESFWFDIWLHFGSKSIQLQASALVQLTLSSQLVRVLYSLGNQISYEDMKWSVSLL
jgi:hypothetical protein